ncbi:riboflavin biosynthesis protein RibF [Liquorilactobacillus mali]|uniref:Riboflavin biosynthesis protein n=1 Tax=Liquorilactobacillus mali TaxID=1618 RepID=A0A0R2FYV3_9LACO|nr:riboflavin biosynthesis protein RibF [Liquorilactobacillus mali]KRN30426.1 bifunctional riboflavin kinase FMN adenylyltransferase [Liquorilactobacillus mali]MDN7144628.1 riboflavin biosynthesis protein RibF [Liquorilactobacillus mali]
MQVINLVEPFNKSILPTGDIVLALGFFDGVHRGHQAVIHRAKAEARKRNVKLAVMTLDMHPSIPFKGVKPQDIKYLTSLAQKNKLFEALGADIVYVVSLNDLLVKMGPQEFVDKYMAGLNAQAIVAGSDYTYGKQDIANMQILPEYAKKRFKVIEVKHLNDKNQKISSTRIRKALLNGKIECANELLGYHYQNNGKVVHGEQRGRELGFPTINVAVDPQEMLPAEGIYAVRVAIVGKNVLGMASIGRNETFGEGREVTIEINLLDFSQMVYGENVVVDWYKKLRGQVKYNGAAGLIAQLKKDEENTRNYFKKTREI